MFTDRAAGADLAALQYNNKNVFRWFDDAT